MIYHGVHHGIPWITMVYHGVPWYTVVYHGDRDFAVRRPVVWGGLPANLHGVLWYIMVYHGIP